MQRVDSRFAPRANPAVESSTTHLLPAARFWVGKRWMVKDAAFILLETFLLELGGDFTFVGRRRHLRVTIDFKLGTLDHRRRRTNAYQ